MARFKSAAPILSAIILAFLIRPPAASAFSDLPETSRYYPAVNYLHDAGIISGYADSTFRPDTPVNRAEFLKLVLISSGIQTDIVTPTGFPDVDENAWYAGYVRKAYAEKWIEGYPDGTFRPEQQINKVEALKIIGQVQEWELPEPEEEMPFTDITSKDWFAPYVIYAKQKNYLEETTRNYIPDTIFSRARISELLFRSFITRNSGSDTYNFNLINRFPAETFAVGPVEEPEAPEIPYPEFTPVTYKTYSKDFFEEISLYEDFPNTFYLNEIYILKGEILSGNYDSAFVFLSQDGRQTFTFPSFADDGTFEIPVVFTRPGNYKMGLIPGYEGESKVAEISVLEDLPDPLMKQDAPQKPSDVETGYLDGETFVKWNADANKIYKITFSQQGKTREFIVRADGGNIVPDWKYFDGFAEGKTYIHISSAVTGGTKPLTIDSGWSEKTAASFNVTHHQYRYVDTTLVKTGALPEIMDSVAKITFKGTANTDILAQAAIIKPDGFVDIIDLTSGSEFSKYYGSEYLPSGSQFTFSYTPETAGTYAVEINGIDGSAVLNYPVYVANGIPLIPNFFDLYENNGANNSFILTDEITAQINLINKERIRFGLNPVIQDGSLNFLAQTHSDDMVERNFFGHINPDGETPNDRRIRLGIPTPVGENLAIAPTSEYTVYGLMQSGVHRKNILDPKWTKVGIGITRNGSGSLFTAQEFSTDSLTESDLVAIENSMLERVNNLRAEKSLVIFTLDGSLETPAEIWTDKMAGENFFDFTSPDGETLSNVVRLYVPAKMVQALILEGGDADDITAELLNSDEILDEAWQKIGIGINTDSSGILKTTILFTTL